MDYFLYAVYVAMNYEETLRSQNTLRINLDTSPKTSRLLHTLTLTLLPINNR